MYEPAASVAPFIDPFAIYPIKDGIDAREAGLL
jgi:hypothetical protein